MRGNKDREKTNTNAGVITEPDNCCDSREHFCFFSSTSLFLLQK